MSDANKKGKTSSDSADISVFQDAVDADKQETVLNKYDKDAAVEKERAGLLGKVVGVMGGLVALYVVITCGWRAPEAFFHRVLFLAMSLPLVFLLYPMFKKNKGKLPRWYDYIFIAAFLFICAYLLFNHARIITGSGLTNRFEQILFFITFAVVLEGVRRVAGLGLVCIIAFFVFYAFFGKYFPGALFHPGLSLRRISSYLFLSTGGLFGTTVGTVAGMVSLFIIFATFMEKSGVGRFINDIAMSVTGAAAGGPAKVSVVTSALFGTISGNAVSNVVTTGAFTIPLMKKTGYSPEFAGAVEAVASTAGQLMPPVMGASAFIMADMTGISYPRICVAAIVPVLLYYIGCFTMVHLRAKKLGLKGVPRDQLPKVIDVIKNDGYLFVPFIFVIVMLMLRYTITFVGFWAIPVCILFSALKKQTRMSLKLIFSCLVISGRRLLSISATVCGISVIIGICYLTGITQTLSSVILNLAGGQFLVTIILIAIICIIMGMGLPTASVYMLLSTIAAPALIIGFNTPVLAAHFYVFYFGLLANVTPPVCIPAYAAAGLADSNPSKTAWQGFRLAMGGFLVPFMFIYSPDLLFVDATVAVIPKIITGILGVYMLSCVVEGWMFTRMTLPLRIILALGAMGMVIPEFYTDLIGIGITAVVFIIQRRKFKTQTVLA
jgi:TRAP transporter 4TM/12TM fusion protein